MDKSESDRLEELKGRFRSVAKRRHDLSLETRADLIGRAMYDLVIFAKNIVRQRGAEGFTTVQEICEFLRHPDGAPRQIDIALCPLPPHRRVPFVPAEYMKRDCIKHAHEITGLALDSF